MSLGSGPFFMSSYADILDIMSLSMIWLAAGSTLFAFLSKANNAKMWWASFIACSGSFLASSMLTFYLVFELSLIPILLMILFWGSQPERMSAGLYFLMYTSAFSVPVVIVILMLGSTSLWISAGSVLVSGLILAVSMAPFLVKLPILGLHFWLPKAHVEASTSGSMILAGLLLKLGGYGLLRILMMLKSTVSPKWLAFLTLLASACTLVQADAKKLVAYSSVSHMSFMAIAPFLGLKSQFLSLILLSLAHGWASSGMFLVSGTVSHAAYSRSVHLAWSETKMSKVMLLLGILLLLNSSIPPMPSFFSEVYLVIPLLFSGALVLLFMGVSLFVCYYNVLLFVFFFQKKPSIFKKGTFDKKTLDLMQNFGWLSMISLCWLMQTL